MSEALGWGGVGGGVWGGKGGVLQQLGSQPAVPIQSTLNQVQRANRQGRAESSAGQEC
jgi:hypothetical protein